jgi:hypothetical protein
MQNPGSDAGVFVLAFVIRGRRVASSPESITTGLSLKSRVEISPLRILFLDQTNLPIPSGFLKFLLTSNRRGGVNMNLEPSELVDPVSRSGPFDRLCAARFGTDAVTVSVLNLFQANDDPCRFWPMRGELRKLLIAPISKAYDLSFLSFHSGNLEQFQNVESPGVEEESMMPKQFAELRDCRMILGKHLCSKLIECLAYLRFVQFHDLFLIFGI